MKFDEVIKKRRSHRSYSDKKIKYEDIVGILDAGRLAPSSGNVQNWKFLVIKDKEKIKKITKLCNQDWISEAPVIIIVVSELDKIRDYYGFRGEVFYSIQNCAMAAEHMWLKATDMGLGMGWIGLYDEDKVKDLLKVPEEARIQVILTLGYSSDEGKNLDREDLKNLVYFEEWDNSEDEKSVFPVKESLERLEKPIKDKKWKFSDLFKKKS